MIAGSPSRTAQRVAAYRRRFERPPSPPGADPAADDLLGDDVAAGVDVGLDTPMGRYLRARTAFFDRVVLDAIGRGVTQLVDLGAGYDGRAWRYRAPGVTWFEVDHPDTQADKRARLDRLGVATVDVVFVPIDFTSGEQLSNVLGAAGLDPTRESLVCWEGVVAYLSSEAVLATATELRQAVATGSRLAVSVSTPVPDDRRAEFEARVAAMGEPAAAPITADDARPLLARAGWQVVAARSADEGANDDRAAIARRAGLVIAVAGHPQRAGSLAG